MVKYSAEAYQLYRLNYNKKWRLNNLEKCRKYSSDWRKKNKEKARIYSNQWAKKNREKINEYRRNRPRNRRYKPHKATDKEIEYRKQYAIKPNVIFNRYKTNAKNRNLVFEISFDELKNFIYSDCHYCGEKPNPVNGIDRKDNNIGYIKENCLTSCKGCNRIKGIADYEEFLFRCHKISFFLKNK